MRYGRLFGIDVRLGNEVCTDLKIVPATWRPDGAEAFARHGLVVHSRPDGLDVACRIDADGAPAIRFPDDLGMAFDVHVESSDFAFLCGEFGLRNAGGVQTCRGSSPGGGDLLITYPQPKPDTTRPPPQVAAVIEIAAITETWLAAAPTFVLALPLRRVRWAYYVVSKAPQTDLRLTDTTSDDKLIFDSGVVLRPLLDPNTDPAANDPVGRRLVAAFPGHACARFTSTNAVACYRRSRRRIELRIGSEVHVSSVPHPSIHDFTLHPDDPSQIVLFHTVEL